MPPKEPTRAQYSSRLTYQGHTPAFLLKLQNQVAGRRQDEDEDEPQYEDGVDEFGRERRPPVTDDNERRSHDESDEDEKPVIVVVKEGKHLSQLDVINEGRKAKGLPPLPSGLETISIKESEQTDTGPQKTSGALSFSSKNLKEKATSLKRKFPEGPQKSEEPGHKPKKKKSKKSSKGALSFDRDEVG